MTRTMCRMDGCKEVVHSVGLCNKHRSRELKHGDPAVSGRPTDWGKRESHPNYQIWAWQRRKQWWYWPEAWRNDFWRFVDDVGVKPSPEHKLKRIDLGSAFNKDNFVWELPLVKVSDDTKAFNAAYQKAYRKRRPDRTRSSQLKKMFGISLQDYLRMQVEQDDKCAICGKQETTVIRGKKLELSVDHCHKTHAVRGLLCRMCNQGIGMFQDDTALLNNAVDYLKKHT